MSTAGAIEFTKAEANGNDFLIVSAGALPREEWPAFTRFACNRHLGIGADGVEFLALIESTDDGLVRLQLTLLNADGGEAEISGNGSRCVAAFWAEGAGVRELILVTAAGPRRARLMDRVEHGYWLVDLEMGVPSFATNVPDEIEGWPVTAVSMGNPHCCIFVDDFPADWEQLGARLERHPAFPQRTNVEFIKVQGASRIELRIFERGVGPTQSSGTGSCAAAVAAIAGGAASPVEVITPGGNQTVAWAGGPNATVTLRGPARMIATGQIAFGT